MGNIKCVVTNKTQSAVRVSLDYPPGKSGFVNREILPGRTDQDEFRAGPENLTVMVTGMSATSYKEVINKNEFEGEIINIEIYDKNGEFIVVHNQKSKTRLQTTKINVVNHARAPSSFKFTDKSAKQLRTGILEPNILNQIELETNDDEVKIEVMADKDVITRKVPIVDKLGEINIHEFDGKLIVITDAKTKQLVVEFMEKVRLGKSLTTPDPQPILQTNNQTSQITNKSQYFNNPNNNPQNFNSDPKLRQGFN